MSQTLGAVTLLVRAYDEAIDYFTNALGFVLIEDVALGPCKRWVVVGAAPAGGARILLAEPSRPEQGAQIGRQAGGRVAFFLHTDDFTGDHAAMLARGVQFEEPPRQEPYGTVAVFRDLYGNRWDLVQHARA
jgi:catechol 2,3-dioxygenase-like lactoylglutathione lyase family enzyme